jgi:hypothetical protein
LTIHAQRFGEALAVIRGTKVEDVRAPGVALQKDGMHDAGLVHNDLGLDAAVGQAQQLHSRGIAGRDDYGARENEES